MCSAVACGVDLLGSVTEAEGECCRVMVSGSMCQVAFSLESPACSLPCVDGWLGHESEASVGYVMRLSEKQNKRTSNQTLSPTKTFLFINSDVIY